MDVHLGMAVLEVVQTKMDNKAMAVQAMVPVDMVEQQPVHHKIMDHMELALDKVVQVQAVIMDPAVVAAVIMAAAPVKIKVVVEPLVAVVQDTLLHP